MSAATVTDLQRELLAICKGGRFFNTWAAVNGVPENERVSFHASISKRRHVFELRARIVTLDPKASIYPGWCDNDGTEAEIRASLAKAAARSA